LFLDNGRQCRGLDGHAFSLEWLGPEILYLQAVWLSANAQTAALCQPSRSQKRHVTYVISVRNSIPKRRPPPDRWIRSAAARTLQAPAADVQARYLVKVPLEIVWFPLASMASTSNPWEPRLSDAKYSGGMTMLVAAPGSVT
jgi:hypothetical protein